MEEIKERIRAVKRRVAVNQSPLHDERSRDRRRKPYRFGPSASVAPPLRLHVRPVLISLGSQSIPIIFSTKKSFGVKPTPFLRSILNIHGSIHLNPGTRVKKQFPSRIQAPQDLDYSNPTITIDLIGLSSTENGNCQRITVLGRHPAMGPRTHPCTEVSVAHLDSN